MSAILATPVDVLSRIYASGLLDSSPELESAALYQLFLAHETETFHPVTTFPGFPAGLTKAQERAFVRVWLKWEGRVSIPRALVGVADSVMVRCDYAHADGAHMWLGIEPDGYVHS